MSDAAYAFPGNSKEPLRTMCLFHVRNGIARFDQVADVSD